MSIYKEDLRDVKKCLSAGQCASCSERDNCTAPLCGGQNDEDVRIDMNFTVTKSRADLGLVSGWANVSVNADGSIPFDWQDDIIPIEVLEKAAIGFMQDYRQSGVEHQGSSRGTVVESIVFTKEKQEALGIPEGTVPQGWFITVKVDDPELFEKVKAGQYRMFSIQGKMHRVTL